MDGTGLSHFHGSGQKVTRQLDFLAFMHLQLTSFNSAEDYDTQLETESLCTVHSEELYLWVTHRTGNEAHVPLESISRWNLMIISYVIVTVTVYVSELFQNISEPFFLCEILSPISTYAISVLST
ncbi:hypothetical protein CDAR_74741 [Caerostris darwini]|uniref:Uncharacterized protein n=1 Tax=Caerostris darwini TaxID=1538125 RepID=A0AAV4P3K6_9ARAC|nr:hypothetical protein CDAR_74741 [Caerostris darwini]